MGVGITIGVLVFLIVYPYAIYPLLMLLFPRVRRQPEPDEATPDSDLPPITVLIPAHNEGEHLQAKLENTLHLDYPADKIHIIVCSDGSTDETEAIAEQYAGRGVRLLQNRRRYGKAYTVNRLVKAANTELILATDASAMLARDVVRKLVSELADPAVGVAEARYAIMRTSGDGQTEAGYWNLEARIRRAESDRHMLLGASGAGYLARRELMPTLPEDTINDDYVVPLTVRGAGLGVRYVHDAVASDNATEMARTLYYRWVRIAYGNYQMLWRHKRLFSPLSPRVAFPLFRKLLRTTGAPLLVALAIVVTLAVGVHTVFAVLAALGWSLVALSGLAVGLAHKGRTLPRPLELIRFASLAQSAYVHGLARWLMGRREGIWRRPEAPAIDLSGPHPLPLRVMLAKRLIDLSAAIVGLTVFSPIMLVLWALIRLESNGPALYRQERMRADFDGSMVRFDMLKFRSMFTDAEAGTGPVWASKGEDERVTRVGRFIRRFRLDELPQFFNVLRGEMSLVGPRPERPFFVEQLVSEVPFYADRPCVIKPGITGWAQVQVGYDQNIGSVHTKVAHDLAYLAHMYRLSTFLKMEFRVIWRTVFVMMRGTGSG